MKRGELVGQVFGAIEVVGAAGIQRGKSHWHCVCRRCGRESTRSIDHVKRAICLCAIERHRECCGYKTSAEYHIWLSMRDRCNNPNNPGYPFYGGRGIKVCARWENFANFLADMGRKPAPKMSVDRIDNSRGYSPDNCHWTTHAVQMRNTRRNVYVEFRGERLCAADWAERVGVKQCTMLWRLKHWPVERAVTEMKVPA